MLTKLSLRLRVFLFFCLLAIGAAVLAMGALYIGWSRAGATVPKAPFVTAFIIFAFLHSALALAIWLLFDEHVAKPINQLSAALRLRAHSGVDADLDLAAARYLGDLAPAAEALSETATASVMDTAARVARETQRLRADSDRLTRLLTEIPIATILINSKREIVLYDGQAASLLSDIAPPRLRAPLADYFEIDDLENAIARLSEETGEMPFTLHASTHEKSFGARLKALGSDGHMIFIDLDAVADRQIAPRPLVFDFDLMSTAETQHIRDTPLCDLCFVSFDTETTGLSVENDDIVQLGAVRVLNGRIVEGETLEINVNPGRPIPAAAANIHRITDADVAHSPDIGVAGRALHHFARDAVLVAHNAPFDIGLLRKSEARMGVEWDHPVVDTVLLSAVAFGTNEEHSLDALCARLSITIPPDCRHTALGDARATAEALIRLLLLLQGKGIRTFGQLVKEAKRHDRLLADLND